MGIISPYFAGVIFGYMRGTNPPSAPANLYVGLFNGDPLGGGSASEQTTAIRAAGRLPVGFGAPTNNLISNAARIDFGSSVGNATITHAALIDALTGGNIWMSQALPNPRTIYAGDPVYYEVAMLQFGIIAAS